MAANVSITKEAFITQLVAMAATMDKTAGLNNDELIAYFFANFQGSQAFTDADFQSGGACFAQPWLTAAIVTAAITTLQAIQKAFTSADRDNLRAVQNGPVQS